MFVRTVENVFNVKKTVMDKTLLFFGFILNVNCVTPSLLKHALIVLGGHLLPVISSAHLQEFGRNIHTKKPHKYSLKNAQCKFHTKNVGMNQHVLTPIYILLTLF